MILWIDVETTGLDPVDSIILELAAIVTDHHGKEVGRFHTLRQMGASALDATIESCSSYVKKLHENNGLWRDLRRGCATSGEVNGYSPHIGGALTTYLSRNIDTFGDNLIPAGSNPEFDLKFLRHVNPTIMEYLHYRRIDMNTIYCMDLPKFKKDKDRAHRAMEDIEDDLDVFRAVRKELQ